MEISPAIIKKRMGAIYDIYISNDIGPPSEYIDFIDLLRTVGYHDAVYVFLNSNGGRVDTGIQILSAIKDCAATVVTVLDGVAISMAGLIFLAGHRRIVKDNSMLMLHNYSSDSFGKAHEIRSHYEAMDATYGSILADYCAGFLSQEEINRIIKGEDLYFTSKEVAARLEALAEKEEGEDATITGGVCDLGC